MQEKKKILFVVNVDWFFISHRLPIALAAIKAGHDVNIATGITDRFDELKSYGIKVYPLNFNRGDSSPANLLGLFAETVRLYANLRPDVVHLITLKAVLIGGLAAHIIKIPKVVAAISGLGFTFADQSLKAKFIRKTSSWFYQLALNHPNITVIVQNPQDLATVKAFSNLPDHRFQLLPGSGVDLDEFSPKTYPEEPPVLMMASRMLYSKGIEEFVNAAKQLRKSGVDARFVLVGDPDPANPRSATKETLEQWNQEGHIEWWGHQTNMAETIAKSHIFVLPSYYGEGLPKVLIEASACGRAIITTDIPGCRDAIEPNITGLLVPAKDIQSLAQAMLTLIENKELRISMGNAGRKRAEKTFSIESIVNAHLEIYNQFDQFN